MNKEKIAKVVKTVLDVVVRSEERERHTAIMYQPVKPEALSRNDKKKNH